MKRIALAVAAVLLAGCSSGGDRSAGPTTIATAGKSAEVRTASPTATAGDTDDLDPDVQEFLGEFSELEESLDTYWSEQLEGYQAPAETLVFSGTGDDPKTWPTCDGEPVEAENGFYCPPDNTVILDADWMYGEYTRIGDMFLYVVLAHEYGHSVQANLAQDQVPAEPDEEIQADCFSGAFLQGVIDSGEIEEEEGDEQEINLTLAGVAGDFGTDDSHGTLASRASAFEYGRSDGAGACLTPDDYRR